MRPQNYLLFSKQLLFSAVRKYIWHQLQCKLEVSFQWNGGYGWIQNAILVAKTVHLKLSDSGQISSDR